MRGEEISISHSWACSMELPPHARRRALRAEERLGLVGITSACAEKSALRHRRVSGHRNYLRMRGEEAGLLTLLDRGQELPPHARRRAFNTMPSVDRFGITSACAEKSTDSNSVILQAWNYLRMRGEETALPAETLAVGVVL